MSKNKEKGVANDAFIDKIILAILTPILKPFIYMGNILFPSYEIRKDLLNSNDYCSCGREKTYSNCCQERHKRKGEIAIKIIKTYKISNRKVVKVKIIRDEKSVLKKFKPGAINPLNKRSSFVDTSGYDSD
jgi:hypothetical protein